MFLLTSTAGQKVQGSVSRGCQQRWALRRRAVGDLNAVIRSLDWMAGFGAVVCAGALLDPIKLECALVASRVHQPREMATAIPREQAAFLDQLQGRSVFDHASGHANLAGFSRVSLVSFLEVVFWSPFADEAVLEDARQLGEQSYVVC